jgi:hypothetical protein
MLSVMKLNKTNDRLKTKNSYTHLGQWTSSKSQYRKVCKEKEAATNFFYPLVMTFYYDKIWQELLASNSSPNTITLDYQLSNFLRGVPNPSKPTFEEYLSFNVVQSPNLPNYPLVTPRDPSEGESSKEERSRSPRRNMDNFNQMIILINHGSLRMWLLF